MSKKFTSMSAELVAIAAELEAMLSAPAPVVPTPAPAPAPAPFVWTYTDATPHASITLTTPRKPIRIIDGRPYVRIGPPYKLTWRESYRIGQYMARYGK